MEEKLEIKYRTQKQSFEILDDGVLVDLYTTKHKLKYTIPFEDIKNFQHIQKGKESKIYSGLIFSLLLNAFLILGFIIYVNNGPSGSIQWLFSCLAIPLIFIAKNIEAGFDEKHIDATKHLYFIYNKKNAEKVDAFIDLIYSKQKDFYRNKYYKIDHILPHYTQSQRYLWLYENKYINENEYEVIKDDLDKYFNFHLDINS